MFPIKKKAQGRTAGFTLVEVLVSMALSAVILTAVMTTFVMLGRSGYNAGSYSIMEAQSRRALEMFSEDARMASNITWASSTSILLTVDRLSGSSSVTYAYNSTDKTFTRTVTGGSGPLILVRDVTSFAYRRYKVVNGVEYTAANDLETKQIQITLRTVRSANTVVDATNSVLSARVVLRNKSVST